MWRRESYWQGAYGYPRLIITNYAAQPSNPSALDSYIASISNAVLTQSSEGLVTVWSAPPPVAAPYASVVQAAILTCQDVAGGMFTIRVPAPHRSIFLADAITVDPAILANILGNATADGVVSPQGFSIVAVLSGLLNGPAYPGSTLT